MSRRERERTLNALPPSSLLAAKERPSARASELTATAGRPGPCATRSLALIPIIIIFRQSNRLSWRDACRCGTARRRHRWEGRKDGRIVGYTHMPRVRAVARRLPACLSLSVRLSDCLAIGRRHRSSPARPSARARPSIGCDVSIMITAGSLTRSFESKPRGAARTLNDTLSPFLTHGPVAD